MKKIDLKEKNTFFYVVKLPVIVLSIMLIVIFSINMYNEYTGMKNKILNYETTIKSKNDKINDYKKEVSNYQSKISLNSQQIYFMDKNIAICPSDGSGLYHKYSCEHFDKTASFSAFVVPEAKRQGYKPCYYCEQDNMVEASTSETVYITNTGSKYHREGCSYLKSSNPIDKEKAISKGYTACSRCNP